MECNENKYAGRVQFLGLVTEMRKAQKEYFKTRYREIMVKAQNAERSVDREIVNGDAALGPREKYEDRFYFFGIVKQMREYQRRYFRTRSTEDLRMSQKLEKLVDAEIKAGDSWLQAQIQPKLFN